MKKRYFIIPISIVIIGAAVFSWAILKSPVKLINGNNKVVTAPSITPSVAVATKAIKPSPVISFVGPRGNVPKDAPTGYGFWSFAIPVPGVLSRSGQPLLSEFKWLREQGWRGVVDLRVDGERGEVGDDAKIAGFSSLGFQYLPLPIADGSPPTAKQAEQFLSFVTNPANQPVHVHCRGGIGRAGTMVALYRYSVQGWPVTSAIEESRPFQGGVSQSQVKWLQAWASTHTLGSFAK